MCRTPCLLLDLKAAGRRPAPRKPLKRFDPNAVRANCSLPGIDLTGSAKQDKRNVVSRKKFSFAYFSFSKEK